MWLDYKEFGQIYSNDKDGLQDIPTGICSNLETLYEIMNQMELNKAERKSLELSEQKIISEIENAVSRRQKDNGTRKKLINEKDIIFENTFKDEEDIELKISKLDENIKLLDVSISNNENEIIQKKKELIQVRDDLLKRKSEALELKTDYTNSKTLLEESSNNIMSNPITDFEKANIDEADKMIKKAILSQKNDNKEIITDEAVNNSNSTKILASIYQEEAKYERKAAQFAQEILKQISDKKLSMRDFRDTCDKFNQTYEFIHGLGRNTYQFMVQRDIVFYEDRKVKDINENITPKDYTQIDKILKTIDNNFEGKLGPGEYDKAYSDFLNYRETIIDDEKNAGRFFNKLLNGKKYEYLKDRARYFDEITSKFPYSKLPAIRKEKQEFRSSLKVLDNELIKENTQKINKDNLKVQYKEDAFER